MFVVRCLLRDVVDCVFVVCGLVSVARRLLLCVVCDCSCCLSFVLWWSLFVCCCLFIVDCCVLCDMRCVMCVVCGVLCFECCVFCLLLFWLLFVVC